MRYGCFIPSPCAPTVDTVSFTLGPRESRAFDDIVVSQFNTPNSAGGVEFEHSGSGDQLVVTSRLFSTEPEATVGMFIPGLRNSEAHATTVLTSIRNGGPNQGFRTNVGVYNREDSGVEVTFRIIDGGAQVGNAVPVNVAAHSGAQVNRIFDVAGQGSHVTDNAVIVVSATHEVFSYAAVIDNNTTDPIFVVGAQDEPFQATTPGGPTATPTQSASTVTPTATPTPPPSAEHVVEVGANGFRFRDTVSGDSTTTISVGTTVRWNWVGGFHSTTSSGNWDSGQHSAPHNFSREFNTPGTFNYQCTVHGSMMSGTVNVN
jgi:plastocyanin